MATLQEVQQSLMDIGGSLSALSTGLDNIQGDITLLKDMLAQGNVVSQADLDGLAATVDNLKQQAVDALSKATNIDQQTA